jgi:predicted nucleotidyltransferase
MNEIRHYITLIEAVEAPKERPTWQTVIQELKALPYADKIIVFGSVAKGTTNEHSDVDCFITVPPKGIMDIAKRYYGALDPFCMSKEGKLAVRNDYATGWIHAKKARELLRAIKRDGVPLLSLPDYSDPT